MKTSVKVRVVAFVASILVTVTTVYMVAEYAYPETPATRLASTSR